MFGSVVDIWQKCAVIILNFGHTVRETMCIEIKIEFLRESIRSKETFCRQQNAKQSPTICNRLENSIRLQAFPTSGKTAGAKRLIFSLCFLIASSQEKKKNSFVRSMAVTKECTISKWSKTDIGTGKTVRR